MIVIPSWLSLRLLSDNNPRPSHLLVLMWARVTSWTRSYRTWYNRRQSHSQFLRLSNPRMIIWMGSSRIYCQSSSKPLPLQQSTSMWLRNQWSKTCPSSSAILHYIQVANRNRSLKILSTCLALNSPISHNSLEKIQNITKWKDQSWTAKWSRTKVWSNRSLKTARLSRSSPALTSVATYPKWKSTSANQSTTFPAPGPSESSSSKTPKLSVSSRS